MDNGAKKILETVAIKTLHAHNFSRSSTQANQVLTDLLSRYLPRSHANCCPSLAASLNMSLPHATASAVHISTTLSDNSRNELFEKPETDPSAATIPPDGGRAAWLTLAGAYVSVHSLPPDACQ